jgi:hypothetical protein
LFLILAGSPLNRGYHRLGPYLPAKYLELTIYMPAQKKSKSSKFLTVPTRPVPIDRDRSVAGLLEKMEGAGFGARQLAEAHRIWLGGFFHMS